MSRRTEKSRFFQNRLAWRRFLHFIAAFCSAWISIGFFNTKMTREVKGEYQPRQGSIQAIPDRRSMERSYGRSVDLTLFAVVRAMDTLVQVAQAARDAQGRASRNSSSTAPRGSSADTLVFASSAGIIMWAWFYHPESLPKSYNKWIGQAARVDPRLIQVLRDARKGRFAYGRENSQSHSLKDMCQERGWPLEWSDPSKTAPVPCEMVHMGAGPSCHWHALVRFAQTFKFAVKMYLPLQIILKSGKLSVISMRKVIKDSLRSSIFLGAFVGSFYYGVCLSRTLVGARLGKLLRLSPNFWDSGACVAAGCMLCGWSVLVENSRRRQEVAMFVLPRALATLFPRQYGRRVSPL